MGKGFAVFGYSRPKAGTCKTLPFWKGDCHNGRDSDSIPAVGGMSFCSSHHFVNNGAGGEAAGTTGQTALKDNKYSQPNSVQEVYRKHETGRDFTAVMLVASHTYVILHRLARERIYNRSPYFTTSCTTA